MLSAKQLKWFETITQIDGVSGHEHQVAAAMREAFESMGADEIISDALGGVMAVKRSHNKDAKRVMILGHMDEVGFLVKDITPRGGLILHAVGGWFSQNLLSHRIRVTTRKGDVYPGTIGSKPVHMLSPEERTKAIDVKDMIADVGAFDKEDAYAMGIQPGDMVVLDGAFEVLRGGKRLMSKAFDNRYGCVMALDLFDSLKDTELDFDLYVGASVQEEVGLRGAQTMTHLVKPDFAMVLDCSPANDMADKDAQGKLGGGLLIRVMDSSMIAAKDVLYPMIDICEAHGINHQFYFSPGGTDAGIVHKSLNGVKTLTCCVCARNIHTSSSILDVEDYLSAKTAILHYLEAKAWGDVC